MSRSLGLALYAFFAGQGAGPTVDWPPRPAGRLVWMHAPGPGAVPGLLELARRLREEDGHPILLTSTQDVPGQAGLTWIEPPAETGAAARAFLDYWRPETAVLSEGELRPLLLDEAARRGVPMILVDARKPGLPGGPGFVWPGVIRRRG
jgi:3-deoxy-D-manno-octulosonic-acid transferase